MQTQTRLNPEAVKWLWKRAALHWKFRQAQQKIYKAIRACKDLKFVINSSRRLGKSYALCVIAIECALSGPGKQIRYAAPTAKATRKIIIPLIRLICRDAPADCRPTWKAADGMFVFPNGSEIHVSGANNGHDENLRGQAADLCIVDEAGAIRNLSYLVDDILMPQLLNAYAEGTLSGVGLILSSTPPKTPAHDFAEYAETARLAGNYAEFTIWEAGYPDELIHKFMEEAGGVDSTTWKREYLCKFVVDADSAIISEWDDRWLVDAVPRDQYFKFYRTYESMDLGVRDLTVCLFGFYEWRTGTLWIEDEWYINGPSMTTDKIARAVKMKEIELWKGGDFAETATIKTDDGLVVVKKPYRRVADNNNPLLLQDLSMLHNLYFSPTTKDHLYAMVNEAKEFVNAGRLRVSRKCAQLLGCLRNGIWDARRKEFETSKAFGHFDALAALIYLIRNLDQVDNPLPPMLGIDPANTYVPPGMDEARAVNEAAVREMFNLGTGDN